jgi:hypothetical protein
MTITRIVNANLCPTGRELVEAFDREACKLVAILDVLIKLHDDYGAHLQHCNICAPVIFKRLEVD